jgi:hypothetical protein
MGAGEIGNISWFLEVPICKIMIFGGKICQQSGMVLK